MKILQVHNYYKFPGGEDRVFAAETEILKRNGNEVITYTVNNNSIGSRSSFSVACNTIWAENSRRKFVQILADKKPDVIHFHNTFPLISPSAYYACNEARIPVIQTLHNYRLLCPAAILFRNGNVCEDCVGKLLPLSGILYGCYRKSRLQTTVVSAMLVIHRLLRTWRERVNLYIALTDFTRRKYIEGGLPAEKVIVKPNFIYFDPGVQRGGRKYFLFVGRLSQEKGIRTLLKAWRGLDKIPLKIAGDGPLGDETELSVKLKKAQNIELLGRCSHDEIVALMKEACCLILPSEWYECFSVAIIEAFACGLPVITSPLGAMSELIDEKQTGMFFKSGDVQDLKAKVEWAWTHLDKVEQMSKEVRNEYEIKYTAERNYKLLMEIYRKAIGKFKGK